MVYRKKIHGTATKPRLSVFRSNRHIYAQLIDDTSGKTVAAANSQQLTASERKKKTGKEIARNIGEKIAEKAKKAKITSLVFDRGRYRFHGRIKELAQATRRGKLDF